MVGDQYTTSKQAIKHLGVVIDNRLTYMGHLAYIGGNNMPNLGGPKQQSRRLLMQVVTSIAIYGASLWAEAMDKRTYSTEIIAAFRRSAIRVISALRTVSTDAAMVIAGISPLKLVADVR